MRKVFILPSFFLISVSPAAVKVIQPPKSGPSCAVPTALPAPRVEIADAQEVRRVPIGGYLLSLSWSPEFCRARGRDKRHATQCQADKPFGFVLHGLWPEGQGPEWPQWCGPAPLLTKDQVRKNFCMTPSPQLLQHEWAKHGTCMARDADSYFKAASTLFNAVPVPDMDQLSRDGVTVAEFKAVMSARDKTLPTAAIQVKTNGGGWLQEVHICLDKKFQPAACPSFVRRSDDRQRLKIWRTTK